MFRVARLGCSCAFEPDRNRDVWKRLLASAGTKLLRQTLPHLADTYRADPYGYVVAQCQPAQSMFAFEVPPAMTATRYGEEHWLSPQAYHWSLTPSKIQSNCTPWVVQPQGITVRHFLAINGAAAAHTGMLVSRAGAESLDVTTGQTVAQPLAGTVPSYVKAEAELLRVSTTFYKPLAGQNTVTASIPSGFKVNEGKGHCDLLIPGLGQAIDNIKLAFDVVTQPFGQGDNLFTELSIHKDKNSYDSAVSQLLFRISGLSGLYRNGVHASQPRIWAKDGSLWCRALKGGFKWVSNDAHSHEYF